MITDSGKLVMISPDWIQTDITHNNPHPSDGLPEFISQYDKDYVVTTDSGSLYRVNPAGVVTRILDGERSG
ncbi:MAG: hypothetical protein NW237_14390 [Cyanobacteriota bacterium]|nr:hypothetical protein [Cyanobacteriota bacterium]